MLITGGASGIGRCTAEEFAKAGSILILSDINKDSLEKTAEELRQKFNGAVYTQVVDVSQRDQVEESAQWVLKTLGGMDVLINNAGIGHSGELVETSLETWKRLLDINFWGPLYYVYAFLPSMIQQGQGHIVNVSSGQAFFRLPTWGAYATVKLAMGAFSEILHFELKKFNVDVTTFYPFMVNTGFYKKIPGETFVQRLSMKLQPYYSMAPEKVAHILFNAVKKKKGIEMVSFFNRLASLFRVVPQIPHVAGHATVAFLGKKPEKLRQLILSGRRKKSHDPSL